MKLIKKFWDDFNEWIGTKIAIFLSSMGCFWIIMCLTIAPLYTSRPANMIGWIQYIVQTIFQGAALPLLGYVSDRGSKAVMNMIKEMHDAIIGRMEKLIKEMHEAIIGRLNKQIEHIEKMETEELKVLKEKQEELKETVETLHALVNELHETKSEEMAKFQEVINLLQNGGMNNVK